MGEWKYPNGTQIGFHLKQQYALYDYYSLDSFDH